MGTLERIYLLIENNGKSKAIVAKECGLNNSAFTDWKSGKARPSTESIVKIAQYFGVSTDYLLCVTDSPTRPGEEGEIQDLLHNQRNELLKAFNKLPFNCRERAIAYVQCLLDSANCTNFDQD